MSDTIQLRTISAATFERCQMNEVPIRVVLPAGHPGLDGTRDEPVYVTMVTNDGEEVDGYATRTVLTVNGKLVTTLEVS